MASPFRISAKNLGALALPSLCPRCFWIQAHVGNKLPYQIFPGIFSSIDTYVKRVVIGSFDRHKAAPSWLADLGKLSGYRIPPHHTKFNVLVQDVTVLVSGTPDGIFVRGDGSYLIVDYKTAKFTEYQDELFPMYDAQLNAYAFIGEHSGFSPVSGLALVYTEPVTDDRAAASDAHTLSDGFSMDFSAKILPVTIDAEKTPNLCRRAREIYDLESPPEPRAGCKDCNLLENLIQIASR
ncbi:MAG: PD-(D/E)XK nuclease family protein [Acidobacteria bacterium]|nr:PD-(D/E)XK nuclease family protein [Acidobacteriota bacterium]